MFSLDYGGPHFVLLGPAHVGALLSLLILNLSLILLRGAADSIRRASRFALAGMLWGAEASWHLWNLAVGTWVPQYMLPLNLCSVLIWLAGFMLIRKNYHIYEFVYFLGIGAAAQFLATPDLTIHGFPHFRFVQTFTSHGLLLTSAVFMTVVERFRPTLDSLCRVVVGAILYMLPIYLLNSTIGSNFLMLNGKPATPSLLDLLPPWPYYIIHMVALGILNCALLYLPFALYDTKRHWSRVVRRAR